MIIHRHRIWTDREVVSGTRRNDVSSFLDSMRHYTSARALRLLRVSAVVIFPQSRLSSDQIANTYLKHGVDDWIS